MLLNLGLSLNEDELQALFNEIDINKSQSIDIDELVYFLSKNQTGSISQKAASAVLNLQGANKLSMFDMKEVFKNMPSNFTLSFFRNANKH